MARTILLLEARGQGLNLCKTASIGRKASQSFTIYKSKAGFRKS